MIIYIISYRILSYHVMSYHIISSHIILNHILSYHVMSYHIISYHIISYHIISYHIKSYHIISYYIMSYHIISYHIISCQIKSIYDDIDDHNKILLFGENVRGPNMVCSKIFSAKSCYKIKNKLYTGLHDSHHWELLMILFVSNISGKPLHVNTIELFLIFSLSTLKNKIKKSLKLTEFS